MKSQSAAPSKNDAMLHDALDEFTERLNRGERPDIDAFIDRFPEAAASLRPALSLLLALHEPTPDDLEGILDDDGLLVDETGSASASAPGGTGLASGAQALGDFRILREIGRGGMGIVYEAEQISLGRRVALKILPLAGVLDPRHLQRFKNEALAAGQLDHPNIVDVYGVGCERGVHYYAMRLVEGVTLAEAIEGIRSGVSGTGNGEDRVPPSECPIQTDPSAVSAKSHAASETAVIAALSTMRNQRPLDFFRTVAELGMQAAQALEHAHQLGVIHRDIKPSNLMIESVASDCPPRCPKLWVTDFGLARIENDATLTRTGDLLGTMRYMSPEQAEGRSAILDHRSDIYSLGVTLYELVTGRAAFTAAEPRTLLQDVLYSVPVAPRKLSADLPADLEKILLKAIAKLSEDRYQSARDLAEDFERFVENKPIRARPPALGKRINRFLQRHRHATTLTIAAVVLVVAGLVVGIAAIAGARTEAIDQRNEAQHFRRQADENFRGAMHVLTQLVTRSHGSIPASEESLARLRDDQRAAARKFLGRYVDQGHADRESRMHAAIAQIHLGRICDADLDATAAADAYLQAVTAFESLVAEFPEDATARTELAIAYTIHGAHCFRRGELPSAKHAFGLAGMHFQRSLMLQPQDRRTLSAAALFHGCCPDKSFRDANLTRQLAAGMMALNDRDSVAWFYVGVADYRDEKYSEAILQFKKSLDLTPSAPSPLFDRSGFVVFFMAMTHAKAGDLGESRRYWTIAERMRFERSDVEDDYQVAHEASEVMGELDSMKDMKPDKRNDNP